MLSQTWPSLSLSEWKPTYETLQLWTQIVGKVRLALCAPQNHYWQVTLYVNARGLTTSLIPYGDSAFEIQFDFIDHALIIKTADGRMRMMALAPRTVADFYSEFVEELASLDIEVKISDMPQELPDPIPFDQDQVHRAYDRDAVHRFWLILLHADALMQEFRSDFLGKASPVHFFWGSFDLAVTRFSGRIAPARPNADKVTREAYSHEVISCGFWPGSGNIQEAAFYAYAAPEPPGFATSAILPPTSFYNEPTHGFVLRYDDVRRAADPDRAVLDFFRSTYEAGANLAKWDRRALERAVH